MRLHSRLLPLASFSLLTIASGAIAAEPPFDVRDVQEVRHWLSISPGDRWRKEYKYLLYMGEKVFPAYEAILSDPKRVGSGGVFGTLAFVEADRRRFIKYALPLLRHKNSLTRHIAVGFLEDVGSRVQAPLVVPLLSDEKAHVVLGAAYTLAAIGGENELTAMDEWLRSDNHRSDSKSDVREVVQERRDQLKKRLDENKDPKKRKQRIRQYWKDLLSTEWVEHDEVNYAVRDLTAFRTETIAFLKDHLHPIPAASQKHLDQLLADLDSDLFNRREAATREFVRGVMADSVLEKALLNNPSLEMRRRLEAILDDLPNWRMKNPELLRQVRAVWVLQQIGTPEAKTLLEKIAAGAPAARLTQKAKDALRSLEQLKKP